MKLIILGTGNVAVSECYNTCFVLSEKEEYFLGIHLHVTDFTFTRNKMQKCYVSFLHNWCVKSYQLLCKNKKSGVLSRK